MLAIDAGAVASAKEQPQRWARLTKAGQRALSYLRERLLTISLTAFVFMFIALPQIMARASTTITIDTDLLFSSVNDWIVVFLPIAAIGLGISIALAVIDLVGDSILSGFSHRRR